MMQSKEEMSDALDAIHDEAVRLLGVKGVPSSVRVGLERIVALARYKSEIPDQDEGEPPGA